MMNRSRSSISRPPAGILLAAFGLAGTLAGAGAGAEGSIADLFDGRLPNNFPFLNSAGTAATFSTAGFVDLTNPFHIPQGTNGRSCESCHLPQAGWSIRPIDVELKFLLTAGQRSDLQPARRQQSDRRTCPRCRRSARRTACCARGCSAAAAPVPPTPSSRSSPSTIRWAPARSRRGSRPSAVRSRRRTSTSRRTSAGTTRTRTAAVTCTRAWSRRPTGNITGAQQERGADAGDAWTRSSTYESGWPSRSSSRSASGWLTACGAKGGPENLSAQQPVNGRFDLFDAWMDLQAGLVRDRAADRKRAQIARGQELFNKVNAGAAAAAAAATTPPTTAATWTAGCSTSALRRPSSASPACRSTRCATRRRW